MTSKKAVLMLLLLLVSGALLWKYERSLDSQADKRVQEFERRAFFFGITPTQVQRLRIVRAEGTYGVRRAAEVSFPGQSWVLDTPDGAPVDMARVEKLLASVLALRSANTLAPTEVSEDQSIYGLVPPELLIRIEGEFGKRVLSFGKEHPVSKRRYVQFEEDPQIYLVSPEIFAALDVPSENLRARKPFQFDPAEVVAVVALRNTAPPLAFRRIEPKQESPFEQWVLQEGAATIPVDGDLFRKELQELSNLEVTEFIDDGTDRLMLYGLQTPEVSIRVDTMAEGQRRESMVHIGKGIGLVAPTDDATAVKVSRSAYYFKLTDSPFVYRFESPTFSDWLQPAEHFRTRTPFNAMSFDDVDEVLLARDAEVWSIKKTATADDGALTWELEFNGEKVAADAERVETWLEEFFTLKVLSYPALDESQDYGFATAAFKISINGQSGTKSVVFGNAVAAAAPSVAPAPEAPRYIGLQSADQAVVPAVISSDVALSLVQPRAYFLGQ